MALAEKRLGCGCKLWVEDGRGPWPVPAGETLDTYDKCLWALGRQRRMVEAYFAGFPGEATPEVLGLYAEIQEHAGLGAP